MADVVLFNQKLLERDYLLAANILVAFIELLFKFGNEKKNV